MSKKNIPVNTPAGRTPPSQEPAPVPESEAASPDQVGENESEPVGHPSLAAETELSHVQAELDQMRDRALRSQAELENYRRRAAREMEQERRYAALPLLRDLLPVWDNVHRAIEAASQARSDPGLLRGVQMVAEQLEDIFRRHGCEKIEALYQPFDPNVHEAITQQPSDEHPAGTVVGETQTGFRLHDRVVRASQVIVAAEGTNDVE